jgi:hypothetical protein
LLFGHNFLYRRHIFTKFRRERLRRSYDDLNTTDDNMGLPENLCIN